MRLIRCLTALFLCLWSTLSAQAATFAGPIKLIVRVEQNPPLSYFDTSRHPAGLMVDLLSHIAENDGRQLEYVSCTWDACLEQLNRGEIDMMATIAYSSERARIYDFTTSTVVNLWGQLYVGEESKISSYLDLAGKRIAVVNNETHATAFRSLVKQFGLNTSFVVVANFQEVFEAIQSGRVHAGVVGRFFALAKENEYKVKATQILFNPIEVRYAVTKGKHSQLLADIDRQLVALQNDRQSFYYCVSKDGLELHRKVGCRYG